MAHGMMAAAGEEDDASPVPIRRRKRRFRFPALLLASFGWMAQAALGLLVFQGADATPLLLLFSGASLLALTLFAEGDLPLAAVGVAAIGALITSLATLSTVHRFATDDDALWLLPLAMLSIGFVAAPWIAAQSARASRTLARRVIAFEWVVIAAIGILTFPTVGPEASGTSTLVSTEVDEPAERVAPRGAWSAAHHVDREEPALVIARPARRAQLRPRSTMPLGFAGAWWVGLVFAAAGTLALQRSLARLARLERAVPVRRRRARFVLEGGDEVVLDHAPRAETALVVLAPRAIDYRGDARARGEVVGLGTLEEQRAALQQRIATAALGTVLTTSMAWLPLLLFRLAGWALAPIF